MQGPTHLLAAGCTLLLLAASTANAQDSIRRKVTLPTKPSYQQVVTRLCNVYQAGALYCRNIDDLHAKEWAKVDRTRLQEAFKKVYEANGFDLRYNGLINCGSDIPAASRQSLGPVPTAKDAKFAIDACLKQFGVAMGRGRGVRAFLLPEREPTPPVTGSCAVAGDPRLAEGEYPRYTPEGGLIVWADEIVTREDGTEFIIEGDITEYLEPLVPEEPKDGGTEGRTEPGASSCQALVWEFQRKMAECDRIGYTSYFCEKMKACSDPMVTDPNPGGPAMRAARASESSGKAVRCGEVEVFSEDQLRAALLKHCGTKVQYDPNSGSPCGPRGGGSYRTTEIVKNLCNSHAPILTEDCLGPQGAGEVTFPTLRKSVQEIINEASAKLGGPIMVLPVGPPSTGPRPVCPPNCKSPDATESASSVPLDSPMR